MITNKSLSYLHTGAQLEGITHPILWKTSPSGTTFAIISKCNPDEQTLQQIYFSSTPSQYQPPSVPKLCQLAISIVKVLDEIHSRKVRHGNLRPDVISLWQKPDGESHVCIRDFTESTLLVEAETPPSQTPTNPVGEDSDLCATTCGSYVAPETLPGSTHPGKVLESMNL